ncbi:MAG: DUF3572 domain-containing protein [Methylobacteriaceae bacterium]|nr:DUF3572 domain-containing protein [Methylobacteriaceae bacterium]MBV9219462.1 DUF3572 domain-containing protein [Methylobacteriaceae bacterium]MBV9245745.1 DUF3572 domain-containing protein [Methylobacteriaceae bacterium]MBV9637708.1 DUF3572 domain-containing protein [Methylobacteriaceae bacterium]MBV9704809.1 DUF3572 domain-containing protein [Methylobacteriaceae bacterium]
MKPRGEAATRRAGADPGVDEARGIAVEALSFLATDPERIGRFLELSGLTPQTLRAAAASSGFLAAVLDHVTADASLLLMFAANTGRDPIEIARAREILAGPGCWPEP